MRTALPTGDPSETVLCPLLTADQAGVYLHLHRRTLANMRSQGRGPRYVRSGARALYRLSDLDAFLDEHTYAHMADERARRAGAGDARRG